MSIFDKNKQIAIKDLIGGAIRKTHEIPESGGQLMPREGFAKILKELLPYKNLGSYLSEEEAKLILRKMRTKEEGIFKADEKLNLNRLRRVLEQEWGLTGKY